MKENIIKYIMIVLIFILSVLFTYTLSYCADKNREEYVQTTKYELTVIDKYETIGSNFHLIGGRTSETEYHIIYNVKPLTENAKKNYYGSGEEDDEVDYKIYRKLNIGRKVVGTYNFINGYTY